MVHIVVIYIHIDVHKLKMWYGVGKVEWTITSLKSIIWGQLSSIGQTLDGLK